MPDLHSKDRGKVRADSHVKSVIEGKSKRWRTHLVLARALGAAAAAAAVAQLQGWRESHQQELPCRAFCGKMRADRQRRLRRLRSPAAASPRARRRRRPARNSCAEEAAAAGASDAARPFVAAAGSLESSRFVFARYALVKCWQNHLTAPCIVFCGDPGSAAPWSSRLVVALT